MRKEKLTKTLVQKLEPGARRYDVYDTDVTGLFCRVEPSGKRSYVLYCKLPSEKYTNRKLGDAAFLTPAQAREMAVRYVADMTLTKKDPKDKPKEGLTLLMVCDEYLAGGGNESNVEYIKRAFKDFLPLKVEDITRLAVEKSLCLCTQKKATVNRRISAFKAVLSWAAARELVARNPLAKLKKYKESDSVEKTRYLTEDEERRLLAAVTERDAELRAKRRRTLDGGHRKYLPDLEAAPFADYFMPLVVCALNTGIRRNALFSLRWDDVDLERETVTLQAGSAKSKKSAVLPLNKVAADVLRRWKTQAEGSLVFPSPKTGGKLNNCTKAFKDILKKAGIENFTFHDMRHNFASQLVMRGVDLNTVRELMTHSDIKMTLRYAHLAPEGKKAAVELLCAAGR